MSKYLEFAGIIRFEARDASWSEDAGVTHVQRLRKFYLRLRSDERVGKTARALSLCAPRGTATASYSDMLSDIMRACTLSALSLTYDGGSRDGVAGWLPHLVHRSAGSLTHLDIALDATNFDARTIELLNELGGLVWLRVREFDRTVWHGDFDFTDGHFAAGALPRMRLPHLEELHVSFRGGLRRGCHIPLSLARHAHLPALTKLWISSLGMTTAEVQARVRQCLHALGRVLRELGLRCAESMKVLDTLGAWAPHLTDLVCLTLDAAECPFWYDWPYHYDMGSLNHPGLRRLTLSGEGKLRWLVEGGRLNAPDLLAVTFHGRLWTARDRAYWTADRSNPEPPDDGHWKDDVLCAAALARRRVVTYDECVQHLVGDPCGLDVDDGSL